GAACMMSSALPSATRPRSSTRRIAAATFRRASACAAAPPSSPAPMIAMSRMGMRYCKFDVMESLNGKVALVTGGSRGIGLAIARALVANGATVSVTGKSDAHLSAARPMIEGAGPGRVETLRADVRRYDEVERAVGPTVARCGGLASL